MLIQHSMRHGPAVAAAALALWTVVSAAHAANPAPVPRALIQATPNPASPVASFPAPSAATSVKVPEGTEVQLRLGERLSSATAAVGDTFEIVSDEEVTLPDGTILPAGYSGRGEVTIAEKNGMLGKSGQLGIRMNYLKVGTVRVHLRANKSGEGKSGVTNTVVVTVLFGPLGLLVHGHSIVYPKGQPITAYVDQDTQIDLPLAPPPLAD
jgi:hypothetical protein